MRRTPQPLPLPLKRLILLLRLHILDPLLIIQLQIHFLIMLHIQQLQGCASLVDHGECGCVGGIVVAVEWAVVDGEPVGPEVQDALDSLGWAGDAGAWIVYYAGFCAFAAEGDAASLGDARPAASSG